MLRLGILPTRSLAPALLCALVLAACGGSQPARTAATTPTTAASSTTSTTGARAGAADMQTLYIYSSLPHNGPQAAASRQIEEGIGFARDWVAAHQPLAKYRVVYRALSDSRVPRSRSRARPGKPAARAVVSNHWNATATVQNAQVAAGNPRTVAYIGDLNSGATELSLPILNQAGIVQLTPGSGYPGLTEKVPGVTLDPTEPDKYYPQGRPSLLRLVPNDLVQAQAAAYWLKKYSYPACHTLAAVAFGGDPESTAMVLAVKLYAKRYKLAFVPTQPPTNDAKTYASYVSALVQHQVNCIVVAGRVTRAAIDFTTAFHTSLPGAIILGTSGLCNRHWSDPARGGVPSKVDSVLYCTTPLLPLGYYPGGRSFSARYRRARHRSPTAYTYLGYMAGSLVLQAIREIGGAHADSRRQVMSNLVTNVASIDMGAAYTFDPDGDPTGEPAAFEYGLDKVDSTGIPRRYRVLAP